MREFWLVLAGALLSAAIYAWLNGDLSIGLCCYGDSCGTDIPPCRK